MTKDDFQKSASNTDKRSGASSGNKDTNIVSFRPQVHAPRAPAPRGPAPKAPFGMHIMPVATSIRVLPELVKSGSRHVDTAEVGNKSHDE